jgi:hypothetical protein
MRIHGVAVVEIFRSGDTGLNPVISRKVDAALKRRSSTVVHAADVCGRLLL